jgi:lysozyme-like protein
MSTLTVAQARTIAGAAGFTGTALDVIVAIAQAESGLVTDARNQAGNTPPSTDRGILQVNSYWHPEVSDACCDDPACAFAAGYTLSAQGTDFTPWSTFGNGAYRRFLPMEDVLAPDAATMKEFFTYHGDCGQLATLAGLHTRNPLRWPLNGATLNAITDQQIAAGYADASLSGGQNIYSIARWLREHENVPCTVVGWDTSLNSGGAVFSVDGVHNALKAQISMNPDGTHFWKRPVVIEVSTTGAGLIEDEHNVQFHFIGVGGVQLPDGGWYRWDGDAVSYNDPNGGLMPLILTSWSEIANATPIAWLVVELDAVAGGAPVGWTMAGNVAHDNATPPHTVGTGLAQFLIAANAPDGRVSETHYDGTSGSVFVDLVDGRIACWRRVGGATWDKGGDVVNDQRAAVANALAARDAAVKAQGELQAALTAAQQQLADALAKGMTPAAADALAVMQGLKKALGEV